MPVGPDGRVHTIFTHNPSTLRLSSHSPNMQNLPRGGEYGKWVKSMFVAPEGRVFWARDFSAIEAVLVGYFAGSARYTRFAKLGVHAYLTSHLVGRPAELSWPDTQLKDYFSELKRTDKPSYETAKRVVHLSNYMGTPKRMQEEYPETFKTVKDAARLQGFYFDLFPEIKTWHREFCERVDGTRRRRAEDGEKVADPWTLGVCHVRNPFGYVHRFYNVLDWERIDGKWYSTFGEDAKRLIASMPQGTAAGVIKRSARGLAADPVAGPSLRLLIHDEIFGEVAEGDVERCLSESKRVMEAPIPELPLDPAWGMGEFLSIGSEAKVGRCWGEMKGVE